MPANKQRSERKDKPRTQVVGRSLDSVVGRFSFAEFLGSFYVRDPMGGVIALCSKSKYAEEIVDALNAMRDSKEKCRRNRDNWKKRDEAAEAKLDWLMVQGIRGIAPGWVGIPEVEWDSTYPPNNQEGQENNQQSPYPLEEETEPTGYVEAT